MSSKDIENAIRKFLQEELMKDQAEFASLNDELDLDSLDQTELMVFLNEEFKVISDQEQVSQEALRTLDSIISLASGSRKTA